MELIHSPKPSLLRTWYFPSENTSGSKFYDFFFKAFSSLSRWNRFNDQPKAIKSKLWKLKDQYTITENGTTFGNFTITYDIGQIFDGTVHKYTRYISTRNRQYKCIGSGGQYTGFVRYRYSTRRDYIHILWCVDFDRLFVCANDHIIF
ncbi:8079_t:CDS:1 [Funneliformis mosseae]|uniref:8079_t:CDS:1 n=1 Tax=Funneliformis mosseae TaxID=27381 RepID=A0A9N9FWA3_FUNMO|nr:8079_t:CDS:1 [Funneliformis mosseae]